MVQSTSWSTGSTRPELVDLLDDGQPVLAVDGATIELKLAGYAHHWFRLQDSEGSTPP